MKKPGQIVVLQFPQTDLIQGKWRPALLIAPLPGLYEDWLACMISTKLHQVLKNFDEVVDKNSSDFVLSGLKIPSVIRIARLAVVSNDGLIGCLGEISSERLKRIRENLSTWISGGAPEKWG